MGKDNKTVFAILGLLNHEAMTGYDIKKRIDTTLSFFWNAGFGQIYPTLKGMEENGLVTKKENFQEGRNRIIYSITELGKEELKEWIMTPTENEYVKYEILLKLFFGAIVPSENNIKHIDEFKGRNVENYNILKGYEEELSKILKSDPNHLYYYLTVLFGEKLYKAYIEWSEEAIMLLKDNLK